MNLRHIEIFHSVYLHRSVSGAARALNVSQPSVTKTLRHAESLLGFALFDRVRGRLVPTDDAHQLFVEVSEIQNRVNALRQSGQNLRHGRGGLLRISALPSLGLGVIPRAIAQFNARHPDIGFEFQTTHHDEMVQRLYERETDIVIGYEVPPSAPVSSERLGEGALVAIYPDSYAVEDAGAHDSVALSALANFPFISTLHSGPIGRLLSAELARQGVSFQEISSVSTFYTAAALAGEGLGFTVVDSFTADAYRAARVTARSLQPALTFDVHAVYLEARPPSKMARAFLDLLKDMLRQP